MVVVLNWGCWKGDIVWRKGEMMGYVISVVSLGSMCGLFLIC